MEPDYQDDDVTVYAGDCTAVLRDLPDASVDAVVTDPPYALEFMGAEWDSFGRQDVRQRGDATFTQGDRRHGLVRHGVGASYGGDTAGAMRAFQEWCELWARECLRVLKPGGHLLSFGGTRTYHRLVCAVEDAGFEIRDSIDWIYGNGFPKSLDVGKAIDKLLGGEREVVGVQQLSGYGKANVEHGQQQRFTTEFPQTSSEAVTAEAAQWNGWGTALKPAHEPIVVARKPLAGTVAGNVLAYDVGALNVDGCRVEHANAAHLATSLAKNPGRSDMVTSGTYGANRPQQSVDLAGRWPTNIVLSHGPGCVPVGVREVTTTTHFPASRPAGGIGQDGHAGQDGLTERAPRSEVVEAWNCPPGCPVGELDSTARYFPTFRYETKAGADERPAADGTAHPTVKPVALMQWLVRLVVPRGGLVLDPFLGSGTTAEACVVEGMRCIGIERKPEYLPLIRARLRKPITPTLGLDL